MQFSTIFSITLSLVSFTFANPVVAPKRHNDEGLAAAAGTVSPEVKANVSATIAKWQGDIETVNNFVDTVGGVKDNSVISSMAATAFVAAQDEGISNTILQDDVTLDASGQAAAKALIGQFGIIGPAINDTISNPGNLQKNLDAINGARCPPPVGKGAISQEGDVQSAAASAVGISIPPPATPTVCNSLAKATN